MMYIYPNRILSLDMGNHSYKYIEAQLSNNRFKILRFGTCQKSQLFSSNSPAKMWRNLGIRSRNVVLSFHHKSLITRELELKANDEFHLQSVIQEEFLKYQTDLNEDFDFDYSVQSHDSESGIYLTKTAGVSKRINREYLENAILLGLRPSAVDIQTNAIIRVLRKALEQSKYYYENLPCLVLDLGYDYTTSALVNSEEIISLKCISTGCRKINNTSMNRDKYLQEITQLCSQMIGHYVFNFERDELKQGILCGGGVHNMPTIISSLKKEIPLEWNNMNYFRRYLSNIPVEMDLNLYGNCLGSILWEGQKLQEVGKKSHDRP